MLATHLAEDRPDYLEFLEAREEAVRALEGMPAAEMPVEARARMEESLRWGEEIRTRILERQVSLRQQLLGLNQSLELNRQLAGTGRVQKASLVLHG